MRSQARAWDRGKALTHRAHPSRGHPQSLLTPPPDRHLSGRATPPPPPDGHPSGRATPPVGERERSGTRAKRSFGEMRSPAGAWDRDRKSCYGERPPMRLYSGS